MQAKKSCFSCVEEFKEKSCKSIYLPFGITKTWILAKGGLCTEKNNKLISNYKLKKNKDDFYKLIFEMDGKEYISNRRFAIIYTYKYYLTEVGREILGGIILMMLLKKLLKI
jgi:hypothetical protein